jgi:uncharacterized SAM-binding protein YcdF (DUF218 family)
MPEQAIAATVLVVLGAAVRRGGEPSPTLRRRALWAARLSAEGRGDWLLATGGIGDHPPAEADVIAELAVAAGVPRERVLIEPQARTTWDSARLCAPIIRARGFSRTVLVTDAYHARRARIAFRAYGIDAEPCDVCAGAPGTRRATSLRNRLRELLAIPFYLLKAVVLKRPSSSSL